MDKKEFTIVEPDGKEIKLVFRQPTYEEITEADKIYASKISELIRENTKGRLVLRQEVNKFMRESGLWTEKDEKELQEAHNYILDALGKLKKGGTKLTEGRQLAISIMDKRREIFNLNRKFNFLDNATIESVAENEKNDYLVYAGTEYADTNERYWNSFEDMKGDKLSTAYDKAANVAVTVLYNVNTDFESDLPESKWLKKYNFVDKDLNFIDRNTGKRVDRDGKPVEELEKELNQRVYNLLVDVSEPENEFIDDTKPKKAK